MKNIHVLATDKPSRIYLIKSNNRLGITSNNPEFTENFGSGTQNQNIYITSDEGIKEGNWVVDNNGLIAKVITELTWHFINSKKIILTTDQDLIADGVQAIDDDFLEWFFNNSNCEQVEINSEKIHVGWEPDYSFEDIGIEGSKKSYQTFYKIIIPKEEPKQEKLEEAAKEYLFEVYQKQFIVKTNDIQHGVLKGFIEGAKWQAERMYSEENMQEYAEFCIRCYEKGIPCVIAEDWFKQFKKK